MKKFLWLADRLHALETRLEKLKDDLSTLQDSSTERWDLDNLDGSTTELVPQFFNAWKSLSHGIMWSMEFDQNQTLGSSQG